MYAPQYADADWRACGYCNTVHRNKVHYNYADRPINSAPLIKIGLTSDEIAANNNMPKQMRCEIACVANREYDRTYTSVYVPVDWGRAMSIYTLVAIFLLLIFVCVLACAGIECAHRDSTLRTQIIWMSVCLGFCAITISLVIYGWCSISAGNLVAQPTTDAVLTAIIEYKITQLARTNLNIIEISSLSPEIAAERRKITAILATCGRIRDKYDKITKLLNAAQTARVSM